MRRVCGNEGDRCVELLRRRTTAFREVAAADRAYARVVRAEIPKGDCRDQIAPIHDTVAAELAMADANAQLADACTTAYVDLLGQLAETGLAAKAEVSVKLSAIGQGLGADGPRLALDNARLICTAAQTAGTTVTLDMEDHTTTDRTLETLHELRAEFPSTGAVIFARPGAAS